MKNSLKIGLGFGITSGVITTLGLMVGLKSFTESKFIIIGGVLSIAIADALSDSLGIHISQESDHKTTKRDVWESTLSTLFSKFFITSTFILPLVIFSPETAVKINVIWGFSLLATMSYVIAKAQKKNPLWVIAEHLSIAGFVVVSTNYIQAIIKNLCM